MHSSEKKGEINRHSELDEWRMDLKRVSLASKKWHIARRKILIKPWPPEIDHYISVVGFQCFIPYSWHYSSFVLYQQLALGEALGDTHHDWVCWQNAIKVSTAFAGTREKCVGCSKTVYPIERVRFYILLSQLFVCSVECPLLDNLLPNFHSSFIQIQCLWENIYVESYIHENCICCISKLDAQLLMIDNSIWIHIRDSYKCV